MTGERLAAVLAELEHAKTKARQTLAGAHALKASADVMIAEMLELIARIERDQQNIRSRLQ